MDSIIDEAVKALQSYLRLRDEACGFITSDEERAKTAREIMSKALRYFIEHVGEYRPSDRRRM